MIAIIDYGAGNLQSVVKAFEYLSCEVEVVSDREGLSRADGAILPGVGSFGDAMAYMNKSGLKKSTLDFVESGKPLLGICLGLQMMFEGSEESPNIDGLGIFSGKIVRIPDGENLKIPHMGWNSLEICKKGGIFKELSQESFVYFVHSYYLESQDKSIVSAQTEYGVKIDCAIQKKNVYATQFHPEKSGEIGLKILRNFIDIVQEGK